MGNERVEEAGARQREAEAPVEADGMGENPSGWIGFVMQGGHGSDTGTPLPSAVSSSGPAGITYPPTGTCQTVHGRDFVSLPFTGP